MKKLLTLSLLFITILSAHSQNLKEKNTFGPRPDLPGDLTLSFGLNMLAHNSVEAMKLKTFGNNYFSAGYSYPVRLGNTNFTFNGGFSFSFEKYALDTALTLNYTESVLDEGQTVFLDSIGNNIIGDGFVEKSKFEANYINIPIEFRYYFNKDKIGRGLFLAAGGSIGYLINGKTKIKYVENEDTKKLKRKEGFELNQFRYGAHVRVGIAGFGAFFNYDVSELFNPGRGPENTSATPYRFGLSINLF
ncbi:PorT family protein [Marivirga sp. S37H4]|uniref:PorT family protein n=1 Tax=Marivirga aurantiaca TaxID=2802615 RepID=A0A934WX93_9BACT|nr:outer membrane beta-barrel protein [Marivirga aurantiaca]MBK6264679.1 PorT family protein [Marivirga aurantiaca]